MSKILITGAGGFIGQALCKKLSSLAGGIIKLSSEDGDIADKETLSGHESDDIAHVFHLASKSYIPDSWTNTYFFYRTNVIGTENVLEFCRKKKISMTYVSAYLYGLPEKLPIAESSAINPNNPYAHSKFLAEQLCEFYSREFGIHITVIRPFNIYGPGQRDIFLIPKIIKQSLENSSIRVMDLAPKRDYVYIDDFVHALTLSMGSKKKFSVYNIGSGASISVKDIISLVQKSLRTDKPVYSDEKIRENELMDVVADISKAKSELGWLPEISFEEGIKKMAYQMERIK